MFLTQPGWLLRAEGLAATVLALVLYRDLGFSWLLFAVLILAPDLAMLGYLAGDRIGAAAYSAVHTAVVPLLLVAAGVVRDRDGLIAIGLIWLTHIAVDRALGYGLKLPTGFKETHLTVAA